MVVAQAKRVKTSEEAPFFYDFMHRDGIEASELANTRGEKEAVRHMMEAKGCNKELDPLVSQEKQAAIAQEQKAREEKEARRRAMGLGGGN